jgi:plasmid replication initiation protein
MSEYLKPVRHPQGDLFVCDITDVILKDDMASMEHPFYSLSKKPDREPRRYEDGKGNWIEFRPSIKGLPTIYDKDLIIYAISQLIAGMKEGRPISKRVRIDPYAFLIFTERGVGGRDYDALSDSLDRIDGTRFRTNVLFEGTRTDEWMGIIDGARMATDERTGKIKSIELSLSEMVLDTVREMKVLTLHRDYFRLSRPIERRVYEIARKAVGQDESWAFLMATLHKKSGSKGTLREFRRQMKPIIEGDFLPDYMIVFDEEKDKVTFVNRNTMPKDREKQEEAGRAVRSALSSDVYQLARQAAPGWDTYALADEFAAWWAGIGRPVTDANALFLKFCKTWFEKKGYP